MSGNQPGAPALAQRLIRAASWMVPSTRRREWLAEWNAELCHVGSVKADACLRFSLGAFQDAFCLRSDLLRSRARSVCAPGTAPRCLLGLAALAACALLACVVLPQARQAFSPVPYRNLADLVVISSDGYSGSQSPTISLADYREWKSDASRLFTQLAFYRPVTARVHAHGGAAVALPMALASATLPRILGSSAWDAAPAAAGVRRLFVRQSAWSADFHSSPNLIGKSISAAGEPAVLAAIIPDNQWRLPGAIDAVLIDDAHQLDTLPAAAPGFAIARIRSSAFTSYLSGWRCMSELRQGTTLTFECIPFACIYGQPIKIFLLALLIACIALPATTALQLGDYPARRGNLVRSALPRRWLFLLAKLLLVVLIIGFGSIACACSSAAAGSSQALCIQLGTSFPALLFAFRWTLHDQRRRCPVCLRLLSNPARVGQPSCNFLAWCGTELMCQSGHGLLHIPELPTCWFSTQRWLCLDASWAGLFPADAAAP